MFKGKVPIYYYNCHKFIIKYNIILINSIMKLFFDMNIDLTLDQKTGWERHKGESESVIWIHNGIESNNNLHVFPFKFFIDWKVSWFSVII